MHSRNYGCTECYSHRFNCGKKQLGQAKAKHQGQKECKESKKKLDGRDDASEPEWMTEEQEREYETLDLRRVRLDNLKESFQEIYTHLWPESKADVAKIPTHCYGSGFLVSTFVIDQIFAQLDLGQTRRSLPSRLPSQQLPYEPDTAEAEDDPSPQPPEENLVGILGASAFDYSAAYVPDPTSAAFLASNNNNSTNHSYPGTSSMYAGAPDTYLPPGSFYSPQPVPAFGGSSNDQFIMSPAAQDESRVAPFPYIIPGSTNPSNQDSAYETNPSDENESFKAQHHHQQHYHPHNAAPFHDWAALHHAGPSGPEQNPPAGDDIQLDEEGAGDELGSYFTNYFPPDGGRFEGVLDNASR